MAFPTKQKFQLFCFGLILLSMVIIFLQQGHNIYWLDKGVLYVREWYVSTYLYATFFSLGITAGLFLILKSRGLLLSQYQTNNKPKTDFLIGFVALTGCAIGLISHSLPKPIMICGSNKIIINSGHNENAEWPRRCVFDKHCLLSCKTGEKITYYSDGGYAKPEVVYCFFSHKPNCECSSQSPEQFVVAQDFPFSTCKLRQTLISGGHNLLKRGEKLAPLK